MQDNPKDLNKPGKSNKRRFEVMATPPKGGHWNLGTYTATSEAGAIRKAKVCHPECTDFWAKEDQGFIWA